MNTKIYVTATSFKLPVTFIFYEGISKSFWTGHLEQDLQMVRLSATRCSCIAILWVSLATFAAITLCVSSQWVFVVVYFLVDSVQKLLDTPLYSACLGQQISESLTLFNISSSAIKMVPFKWYVTKSTKLLPYFQYLTYNLSPC